MKPILVIAPLLISLSAFSKPLIIGGSIALPNEGNGVFQIAIQDKAAEEYNFCTSTKIGKNVFITAAHCFDENKGPTALGISTKVINNDFDYAGVEVENVVIHPLYNDQDENFNSPDVALVFVKNNADFDSIQIRELDLNFVQQDKQIEYWGFGCQKTTNDTDNYSPVKKRANNTTLGKNVLKRNFGVFSETVHASAEAIYSSMILTAGLSMDKNASSLCWGDSGGPVFLDGKIVGINASYLSEDMKEDGTSRNGVTDVNLHVRLSAIKEWILENLNH